MATGRVGATISGEVSGTLVAGGKVSSPTEIITGQANLPKTTALYKGEKTDTANTTVDNNKFIIKVDVNVDEVVKNEKQERIDADENLQSNINIIEDDLINHIDNKNNPHEVNKEQIGLENVDNTSDLDKPISTATQTALNNKEDKVDIIYEEESLTSINILNNTDYTYASIINSGDFTFIIPSNISQGFMSLITLINAKEGVNLKFINNSSYNFRLINNNLVLDSTSFITSYDGRKLIFFRCDGYYIEVTIIEEIPHE